MQTEAFSISAYSIPHIQGVKEWVFHAWRVVEGFER
jgi:hypothetical protein